MPRLLVSLAFIVALGACSPADQYSASLLTIEAVDQPQTIVLSRSHGDKPIVGIRISGSGSIVGEAKISLILNEEPYQTENLSGQVSFRWSGDWYADTAEIRYMPSTASSGSIDLNYEFISI